MRGSRNRQRGSAMVFSMIMVIAITTVVVATVQVSGAMTKNISRTDTKLQAELASDSAAIRDANDYSKGAAILGSSKSLSLTAASSATSSSTPSDNSAALVHSLKSSTTYTAGTATYSKTVVVGNRQTAKPNYYALFCDNSMSTSNSIITGASGTDSDVYANGAINITGASTSITGDLESSSNITAPATASGTVWANAPSITFPTINTTNYSGIVGTALSLVISTGNIIFITPYQYVYQSGNTNLKGVVAGTGVIYVNGNVTIDGNITYATSGSKLAIVATGNVTIKGTVTTVCAYIFCGGNLQFDSGSGKVFYGSFAARSMNLNSSFTMNFDDDIWTDSTLGNKLKLPGFWP